MGASIRLVIMRVFFREAVLTCGAAFFYGMSCGPRTRDERKAGLPRVDKGCMGKEHAPPPTCEPRTRDEQKAGLSHANKGTPGKEHSPPPLRGTPSLASERGGQAEYVW